ncbi:MAG: pitrilysin family protein [candidate division Zixibacteria bacterium]|nr:pitrilysin family protein [candidate division Zixibacteria bacterium]MDD5426614.1 pitrilysin family protein [candidate division Zixibacteria bacterium]
MKYLYILSVLTVVFIAACVQAQNPRDMKFSELTFEPAEPVRFTTDNGLVVYFLEYHELPVVSVAVFFHGGDVYDIPDQAGLTGLTAVLLRTGGAGRRTPDQVDLDLDFVGAHISSQASADDLSLRMNVLKKDINLGFEILSDMLLRPGFDTAKVSMEKSNRQDQIRRQNDNAWDISRRVFYQSLYGSHPYGRFATLASINNISREDIIAQHRRFYTPDNCLIAISGDMTVKEVKNLVNSYFKDWKKTGKPPDPPARVNKTYQAGVYYAQKDINQANIRFGHLAPDSKDPDRFALDLVNFAMGGGGFTSRLTGQVRTSAGLAYSVGSYFMTRPLGGCLFSYCLTRADAMSQAVQMMLDIIAGVKKDGITEEELQMAKESIINSYIFDYDTPQELVSARAYLELMGFPPDQLKKNLEAYKAVTLEDCRRAAAKYLDTKDIVIVITGNKEMFDKPLETFGTVTAVSMEIK